MKKQIDKHPLNFARRACYASAFFFKCEISGA